MLILRWGLFSSAHSQREEGMSAVPRSQFICQALALSRPHVFQGQLSGPGKVVAPVSPAQASLLNIKNICLPLLEMSWTVPRRSCESLPLKQPRGLEWALEIGVQHPGDREGLQGSPKDLQADHPGIFLMLGGSCREEGLGCAETWCPVCS